MQVLTLVAQGQTYRQVAETIGIAERTVKYHMAEILDRLHLNNRAQVIAYAARLRLAERHDSASPTFRAPVSPFLRASPSTGCT